MENKQEILDLLLQTLKATRNPSNLKSLKYDDQSEFVVAIFENGEKEYVNVGSDSGTVMIQHILNQII